MIDRPLSRGGGGRSIKGLGGGVTHATTFVMTAIYRIVFEKRKREKPEKC